MTDVPAHLAIAIENIGKLRDGPDVVRLARDLAKAFPQHAAYWAEATSSTAWCGIMAAWCLMSTGVAIGGPGPDYGPMFVDWWKGFGTNVRVEDRQPGDLALWFGSPHHISFVADRGDYVGGNQGDTVSRAHFRDPDMVRRSPAPSRVALPAPAPALSQRHTGITATVFGGTSDPNKSAYTEIFISDDVVGVSLPARIHGKLPRVRVFHDGRTVVADIVDVGPWNVNDPYWETGERPQAETGTDRTGRRTNRAGIDLTPAAARAIGLDGKGLVDWEFVATENTMVDATDQSQATPAVQLQLPQLVGGLLNSDGATSETMLRAAIAVHNALRPAHAIKLADAAAPASPPDTPVTQRPSVQLGTAGVLVTGILHALGIVGAPIGETATQTGLLSYLLPAATAAFGAVGGWAGLAKAIGKIVLMIPK